MYIHIYIYICECVYVCLYSHPEVDTIWIVSGIYAGLFKDHLLSTPGWLYVLGGLWDLVTTYMWAYTPKYSLPDWPCIGHPHCKLGYKDCTST